MNLIMCKRLIFCFLLFFSAALQAQEGQKSLPNEVWPQLKTLAGVKVGSKPTDIVQLIVLFDPNCPHCAKLWSHLYSKQSRDQRITSLWVPVAYMSRDSAGKAASLLSANSSQVLAENFEKFDFSRRSGATVPIEVVPSVRRSLDRNTRTWEKIMAATPLLIYKTKDGAVLSQTGLPPATRLDAMFGQLAPNVLQSFGQ